MSEITDVLPCIAGVGGGRVEGRVETGEAGGLQKGPLWSLYHQYRGVDVDTGEGTNRGQLSLSR